MLAHGQVHRVVQQPERHDQPRFRTFVDEKVPWLSDEQAARRSPAVAEVIDPHVHASRIERPAAWRVLCCRDRNEPARAMSSS